MSGNVRNPKGWPGIKDHAHKGGTKTVIGKLVNSISPLKNRQSSQANINPNSAGAKIVGFDNAPDKIKRSLENYYSFVSWALNRPKPTKELSEIAKLEGMMAILESNLNNAIERLGEGQQLTDKDRKDMFLMKDTLVAIHEMKYGKKQLNINTDLKDIRDLMFEE